MATITCPQCGFQQEGGPECLRCGIIFARYVLHPEPRPAGRGTPKQPPLPPRPAQPRAGREDSGPGLFVRFYRIFRWGVLAGAVLVFVLILKQAPPPSIASDPQASVRVERKLQRLRQARSVRRPHELRLNEAELNAWLQSNLALPRPQVGPRPGGQPPPQGSAVTSPTPPPLPTPPASPPAEPGVAEVQSTLSNLQIELLDDRLRAYLVFELFGQDLSLLLEGKLRVENGYLRLEPTRVKLGSLPVPRAAIHRAVARLFDSPQNR
ncbi:MAG: hypothetical protein ACE5G6_04015, partial [Terriglobia bacterium]